MPTRRCTVPQRWRKGMFLEAGRVPQNHACCFYLWSRPPEPCLLFSSWSLSPPKPRLLLSFSVKTRKTRSAAFTFSQDPRDHVCCFDFGSRPPERRRVFVFFVWLGSVFFLRLAWLRGGFGRFVFFLFVWLGSVVFVRLAWLGGAWGRAEEYCFSLGLARFFLRLAWLSGAWGNFLFFSTSGVARFFLFVWLGSVGLGEGRRFF